MATQVEAPPVEADFVLVKTTLPKQPLPAQALRQPVMTSRLLIRPYTPDDLAEMHVLRTQPEVMVWTKKGVPDANLAETRERLDMNLDGKGYSFAICDRETGEMIGNGGCLRFRSGFGWPELGYMFRKESWGKGIATEFVREFMRMWAGLEREEVEIRVDPRTVTGDGEGGVVEEQIIAMTVQANEGSKGVLRKAGWEYLLTMREMDGEESGVQDGDRKWTDSPVFRSFPGRVER